MKLRTTFIAALLVFSTWNGLSQKYLTSDQAAVSKSYQGNTFSSEKSLFENLNETQDFKMFAELVESFGTDIFTEEFMGTVFVVPNAAYMEMEEEQREAFLQNSVLQKSMLQFLVVPGRVDAHSIQSAIKKGGGSASFKTLNAETIRFTLDGQSVVVKDKNGNRATLVATDFYHTNGFFHILDGFVFPEETE